MGLLHVEDVQIATDGLIHFTDAWKLGKLLSTNQEDGVNIEGHFSQLSLSSSSGSGGGGGEAPPGGATTC